ncbi:MAG: sigma-70 family RNA polymerase sigma factor [Patescibacteria group bacterium]
MVQNDFSGVPEDPTAFRTFYRVAVQRLSVHALRLTRNGEEAKELCQKTIVRAYLRRRTFRPELEKSVFGWLWTVMKNLAATNRVCRTRSGEVIAQFAAEHPFVWREAEQNAESLLIRAERASELRAALAALPEPFRDTIVRHYFGGETCEQIATVLCISINTVCTRLLRGRKKLHALLADPPRPRKRRVFL